MGTDASGKPTGDLEGLVVPTPGLSQSSGGEPVSPAGPTVDQNSAIDRLVTERVNARLAEIEQGLEGRVERTVQKVKDVRWAEISKQLDEPTLAALVKLARDSNNDPDIVSEKVALRAMRESRSAAPTAPSAAQPAAPASPQVPGKDKAEFEQKVVSALEPFKLTREQNQAVLDEWGKQTYASEADMLVGLNSLIATRSVAAPLPTPSSAAGLVTPVSGQVIPAGEAEKEVAKAQLVDSLTELLKRPTANALAIAQTKAQLRELGDVNFTPSVEEQKRIDIASGKITSSPPVIR